MPMLPRKALRIVGGKQSEQPTFEASAIEKIAIKRFLDFAIKDIKFQFDQMNREVGKTRVEMQEAQDTAVLLSNYVASLRSGIEQMTILEPVA